jgi:hypothetical protein
MITIFWWESLEEVKCWENRGVGKIIILKWIIKKLFGTAWTVFNRLRIGKCEHRNKPLCCSRCEKCLNLFRSYYYFQTHIAPCSTQAKLCDPILFRSTIRYSQSEANTLTVR